MKPKIISFALVIAFCFVSVVRKQDSLLRGTTYLDGMVEHDGQVGQLLKKLEDLGILDNTIVVYGAQ